MPATEQADEPRQQAERPNSDRIRQPEAVTARAAAPFSGHAAAPGGRHHAGAAVGAQGRPVHRLATEPASGFVTNFVLSWLLPFRSSPARGRWRFRRLGPGRGPGRRTVEQFGTSAKVGPVAISTGASFLEQDGRRRARCFA